MATNYIPIEKELDGSVWSAPDEEEQMQVTKVSSGFYGIGAFDFTRSDYNSMIQQLQKWGYSYVGQF